MFTDQKEPVAAPRDIAHYGSDSFNIDSDIFCKTITRHIGDRDKSVRFQFRFDRPDRSLDDMLSRTDLAHVFQSPNQSDRPVAAHSEIADVVKKDHTGRIVPIDRFAKKRTDHRVM